jgi:hypothetical protein
MNGMKEGMGKAKETVQEEREGNWDLEGGGRRLGGECNCVCVRVYISQLERPKETVTWDEDRSSEAAKGGGGDCFVC